MIVFGGKAEESLSLPGGLTSRRVATEIPPSTTDVGNSPLEQASAPRTDAVSRRQAGEWHSLSEEAASVGHRANAIARLLATDIGEDLLEFLREIFARNAFPERFAYSLDEAAELLGISRELVHDLLRTGRLGLAKE